MTTGQTANDHVIQVKASEQQPSEPYGVIVLALMFSPCYFGIWEA